MTGRSEGSHADGYLPHRFPMPAPDAEIIAWKCQACGVWVSESKSPTDCTVDWRPDDHTIDWRALGGAS